MRRRIPFFSFWDLPKNRGMLPGNSTNLPESINQTYISANKKRDALEASRFSLNKPHLGPRLLFHKGDGNLRCHFGIMLDECDIGFQAFSFGQLLDAVQQERRDVFAGNMLFIRLTKGFKDYILHVFMIHRIC